jgi:mRNA-degrading endonuclease HigB of HigAB toxin-antitoxin module
MTASTEADNKNDEIRDLISWVRGAIRVAATRNDFRLVVQIDFEAQVIYVKKVMAHAEYSRKNGKLWKKSCNC